MSYEALHKFLLPNHSIDDVLIDINKITKSDKPVETGIKPDVKPESEVKQEESKLPRKQRRLQERTQAKLTDKEKRIKQKKAENIETIKKTLKQIKESIRSETFSDSDKTRINRVIFGKTDNE